MDTDSVFDSMFPATQQSMKLGFEPALSCASELLSDSSSEPHSVHPASEAAFDLTFWDALAPDEDEKLISIILLSRNFEHWHQDQDGGQCDPMLMNSKESVCEGLGLQQGSADLDFSVQDFQALPKCPTRTLLTPIDTKSLSTQNESATSPASGDAQRTIQCNQDSPSPSNILLKGQGSVSQDAYVTQTDESECSGTVDSPKDNEDLVTETARPRDIPSEEATGISAQVKPQIACSARSLSKS